MERLSPFIYKVTVSFSNPEARDPYSSDYPEEQREVLIALDNPYANGACKAAMNIKDWANTMGLPYNLLQKRIKRGWPVEKALTTKPGAKTGPKPKTTDERLRKVVGI